MYKSYGLTPIAYGLATLYKKYQLFLDYSLARKVTDPLLEMIMRELVVEAGQQGTKVYFLILTDQRMFNWSGMWGLFPDRYQLRVDVLRSEKFNIIDIRKALRASSYEGYDLFHEDGLHYRLVANQVIAEAITTRLNVDGVLK